MITNKMIGDRIRSARQAANLTLKDVAQKVGVQDSTILRYENGSIKKHKLPVLEAIANALNVNPSWLVYKTDNPNIPCATGTPWHTPLIDAYAVAAHATQENVCKLLDIPHVNPTTDKQTRQRVMGMIVYCDPASAGLPLYAESDFERIPFPVDEVPKNADFGIRINGDNMEPTILDGSIVWVHKQPDIQNGEVGIFMLDGGEAVCKRVRCTSDGRVAALESDNEKYKPIKGSALEGLRLVGRVLI